MTHVPSSDDQNGFESIPECQHYASNTKALPNLLQGLLVDGVEDDAPEFATLPATCGGDTDSVILTHAEPSLVM